jgi:hypothetical protein
VVVEVVLNGLIISVIRIYPVRKSPNSTGTVKASVLHAITRKCEGGGAILRGFYTIGQGGIDINSGRNAPSTSLVIDQGSMVTETVSQVLTHIRTASLGS